MKKTIIFLCVLIFLSGCVRLRANFLPLNSDGAVSKTGKEILLTTGDLDRPYKEIGIIMVKGRHVSFEKAVKKLREKAQEVGADAVIKIEAGSRFGYLYRPYIRGVAIVYN